MKRAKRPPRKRVLLADDHLYVSETLRLHLEERAADRFEVVAVAGDGVQAVAETRRLKPDLVVMDVQMPKMDGISALREMKKLKPAPAVLILSAYDDRAHILDALRAGADDYLLKKEMTPEKLVLHMKRAVSAPLPSKGTALGALVNALGEVSEVSGLTVVELDILRLAAHRGATAKDISKELSGGRMSVRTVATLWQHIYEKLGVRSQAQAVCAAVQRGLISAEPEALKMNPKEIK
jgi:DNA-binding NarL/FixJ family response regulator